MIPEDRRRERLIALILNEVVLYPLLLHKDYMWLWEEDSAVMLLAKTLVPMRFACQIQGASFFRVTGFRFAVLSLPIGPVVSSPSVSKHFRQVRSPVIGEDAPCSLNLEELD
jgi:hypothetical protein